MQTFRLTPTRILILAVVAWLLTALFPLRVAAAIGDVFAVPGDLWRIATTGHLLPGTTGTRDLGSASLEVRKGYFQDVAASDDVTVGDDLTVSGDLTVAGAQTYSGNVDMAGALYANDATIAGNLYANDNVVLGADNTGLVKVNSKIASPLIPDVDNVYDLGASGVRWAMFYVRRIEASGMLVAGSVQTNQLYLPFMSETADSYTVDPLDNIVIVTSTAAPRTVTLPTAADYGDGHVLIVKDGSGAAGTNNITITPNGSETIDGGASYVLDANSEAVRLISTGSAWFTW